MAKVDIRPVPPWARKLPQRLRPAHPPIFTDGEVTPADRALALELWRALDPESREWYGNLEVKLS